MKVSHISACLLVTFLAATPFITHANNTNELVLINHFDQPLNFIVGTNPEVLPDLPIHFTLSQHAQIKTKVIDLNKHAYVRAEDTNNHNGFFGISIENNKTIIHGYISKGIAYSWIADTITFCTLDEYKNNSHC